MSRLMPNVIAEWISRYSAYYAVGADYGGHPRMPEDGRPGSLPR